MRDPALQGQRDPDRNELLSRALCLSLASGCAGVLIGSLSVAVGSVGVLGAGARAASRPRGIRCLGCGRFHAGQRHPVKAERAERLAAAVVVVALALVGGVVAAVASRALVDHELPGESSLSLLTAGIALIVLPPLALANRRTAARLGSHALRGDGSITAIGAAPALIALVGLAVFHAFGWWWADRTAALIVATVPASEAYEVLHGLRSGSWTDRQR